MLKGEGDQAALRTGTSDSKTKLKVFRSFKNQKTPVQILPGRGKMIPFQITGKIN
jgi:hypothetical protein